ncbi:MAG: S-adenosylmethionine decarboxylase [Cellvibrionaceae bacterium]|jgi:S-adenosylmethionine decarboxylase
MNNHQAEPIYCKDYFTQLGDSEYAGKHILIDIWGAENLDNRELLDRTLRDSVDAAGATLLYIHIHQFTPTGGLSGTAILAESHINVHTWPERGFAAFDVFMCGKATPEKVEAVIKRAFRPQKSTVELRYRGETQKKQ